MDALLVFLKRPRAGEVKTRLAEALGAEDAAALYRRLAEAALSAAEGGDYRRFIVFTPSESEDEIAAWLPGETLWPQANGDLGQRMATAFEEAFRRGFRRVAVAGTDALGVTRALVRDALQALDDHDLVLGPAADGGYYLLAIDRPRPGLFQGIAWSTPSVLAASVERASALGLSVRLLETLPDVDTPADVASQWPRLRSLLPQALASRIAPRLGLPG